MWFLTFLSLLLTLFQYLVLLLFFLFCLMWIIGSKKRESERYYRYVSPPSNYSNPQLPAHDYTATPLRTPPVYGPPLPPRKLSFSSTPRRKRHVTFRLTPEQERNERVRERQGLTHTLSTPLQQPQQQAAWKEPRVARFDEGVGSDRTQKEAPLVELFPVEDAMRRRKSILQDSPDVTVDQGKTRLQCRKKTPRKRPPSPSASRESLYGSLILDGGVKKTRASTPRRSRTRALDKGSVQNTVNHMRSESSAKNDTKPQGQAKIRRRYTAKSGRVTCVKPPISKRRWKKSFLDKPVSYSTLAAWKQSKLDAENRIVEILSAANGAAERATHFKKSLEEHELRAKEAASREAEAKSLAEASQRDVEYAKREALGGDDSSSKRVRFNDDTKDIRHEPALQSNRSGAPNFTFGSGSVAKDETKGKKNPQQAFAANVIQSQRESISKDGKTPSSPAGSMSSNVFKVNFENSPATAPPSSSGQNSRKLALSGNGGKVNDNSVFEKPVGSHQQKQTFKLDFKGESETSDFWSKKQVFNFGNSAKEGGSVKFNFGNGEASKASGQPAKSPFG